MEKLNTKEPLAVALVQAIHGGDLPELKRLLDEHPGIATVRLGDNSPGGMARSLLHIATDWPGHYPDCAATVRLLVAAGADVNARFEGPHTETPLHWAASSDDVEALDALLDAGADIEAPGAVIAGGTPLTDAVAFAQWQAAHRLVARSAKVSFADAAALGLLDRVAERFSGVPPAQDEIDHAFWYACHGGQRETAEYLLGKDANPNWLPTWENLTPLDAANRNNLPELVQWLRSQGGKSAKPTE
ncbi:MAG: ankyrin repeat domain-containing protein [Woeseia sp.]